MSKWRKQLIKRHKKDDTPILKKKKRKFYDSGFEITTTAGLPVGTTITVDGGLIFSDINKGQTITVDLNVLKPTKGRT